MNDGAFQVSRVSGQPVTDAELLTDLRRVAQHLNASAVSQPQYREHGLYATQRLGAASALGTRQYLQRGFHSPTRSIFQTNVYSRTCLLFGSTTDDSHAEANSLRHRPPYRRRHTTVVLAAGRLRSMRSSATRTPPISIHLLSGRSHPSRVVAPQDATHPFVCAGRFFSATVSLVVAAGVVQRPAQAQNFTLTTSTLGATEARPRLRTSRRFVPIATLANNRLTV